MFDLRSTVHWIIILSDLAGAKQKIKNNAYFCKVRSTSIGRDYTSRDKNLPRACFALLPNCTWAHVLGCFDNPAYKGLCLFRSLYIYLVVDLLI